MAYIVEPDVVRYACTCGLLKPITRLYFCRHCFELRCEFCLCHEVDSHFCGKCLENLPSTEARLKRNRCGNCLECPSCHQQLSSRAAVAGPKNPDDPKATARKVVYLVCLNCRWSSRDVGIPDQPIGNSSWPERENVHAHRLHEVQEQYKSMVLMEKQQKMDKDKKKQKRYMNFTDRTGITAAMLRKRLGLPEMPNPLTNPKPLAPEPATPSEDVEELPAELLTEPINLIEITTIDQRLALPDWQPATVDKLYPVHKQLSVKRSLRCRTCEHNVSKPEYNPISIKFKIQLFAYYHIPEIRIFTVEPLRAGQKCELLIKFTNPTQHQTTITLHPLNYDRVADAVVEELKDTVVEAREEEATSLPSLTQPSNSILSSLMRQPRITVKPREIDEQVGAELDFPGRIFILPPRDDAAEYDDTGDSHNYEDDPMLVVHRKSNKVTVRLFVTPSNQLNLGDEVVIGFTMQHVYTNTIITSENKEPQEHTHDMKVYLSLGKLVGSE